MFLYILHVNKLLDKNYLQKEMYLSEAAIFVQEQFLESDLTMI
jgi:uncharacterized protein YqgQ